MARPLILVLSLALLLVGAANARPLDVRISHRPSVRVITSPEKLNALASKLAARDVTVGCYEPGEPESPASAEAWGYVYLNAPYEYLDQTVCDGLTGLFDPGVATWKKELGVLVITHESYHLNLHFRKRGNEGFTECRAIKSTSKVVHLLGGDDGSVGTLLPFALAIHWRTVALYPDYWLENCKVPNWW